MTLRYDGPSYPEDIPVSEMREGQVGIITRWSHDNYIEYINVVVKNSCGHLVGITGDFFWWEAPKNKACRAKILPNGITLTVVNNE